MSNLTFDVGLAAKLKVAFARNNWTEQLIDAACEGDKLGQFRQILLGRAVITLVEHYIDCDAAPFNPGTNNGWTVEEHQKGREWKFDPKEVELFLPRSSEKNGCPLQSSTLRKELAKKPVFNANVLDYLLAHPELIPDQWKKDEHGYDRYIYFWGTVYRDRYGHLFVPGLYWRDGGWRRRDRLLSESWHGYVAMVRAS